ncbi:Serine/threonine-protein phosphatase 2A activator [Porphyridium purpureum]|uniref:Serine/threonine-protein phosphatase 2A activator n=1 Tax=Porphyridium purpureum TaxID=35688 RepID=A0A5J4YXS8_PORPP|nr:Serine/threonine-protein phosphatase 2A activator [Porphyridium purpureum]|eukprot:POR5697..scf209_3
MEPTKAPWAAPASVPPTVHPAVLESMRRRQEQGVAAIGDGSQADPHETEPYPGLRKRIFADAQLDKLLASELFQDLWEFLLELNDSVRNVPGSSPDITCSPFVTKLVGMFAEIATWTADIPPDSGPKRFGNPSFRLWWQRLRERDGGMLSAILPEGTDVAVVEQLCAYLEQSFGNRTRIDYGSGHEASFLVFLFCLRNLGFVSPDDNKALVLRVFWDYLSITHKLQDVYMLEPAGSHGVWGLDDYAFLPFLWGSSQLRDNVRIPANAILNESVVETYKDEYIYMKAIAFIRHVKKGPFFEHSPMLTDISRLPGGWPKINEGLLKMYRAEVWGKRVVIQHLVFGTLFFFPEEM